MQARASVPSARQPDRPLSGLRGSGGKIPPDLKLATREARRASPPTPVAEQRPCRRESEAQSPSRVRLAESTGGRTVSPDPAAAAASAWSAFRAASAR